jgi:hypothetical protein
LTLLLPATFEFIKPFTFVATGVVVGAQAKVALVTIPAHLFGFRLKRIIVDHPSWCRGTAFVPAKSFVQLGATHFVTWVLIHEERCVLHSKLHVFNFCKSQCAEPFVAVHSESFIESHRPLDVSDPTISDKMSFDFLRDALVVHASDPDCPIRSLVDRPRSYFGLLLLRLEGRFYVDLTSAKLLQRVHVSLQRSVRSIVAFKGDKAVPLVPLSAHFLIVDHRPVDAFNHAKLGEMLLDDLWGAVMWKPPNEDSMTLNSLFRIIGSFPSIGPAPAAAARARSTRRGVAVSLQQLLILDSKIERHFPRKR